MASKDALEQFVQFFMKKSNLWSAGVKPRMPLCPYPRRTVCDHTALAEIRPFPWLRWSPVAPGEEQRDANPRNPAFRGKTGISVRYHPHVLSRLGSCQGPRHA